MQKKMDMATGSCRFKVDFWERKEPYRSQLDRRLLPWKESLGRRAVFEIKDRGCNYASESGTDRGIWQVESCTGLHIQF